MATNLATIPAARAERLDAACLPGGLQQAAAPGRVACAASRSTVVLPMPRGGVLITRRRANLVGRIVQKLQIGQDVLDLLALEKFQAVDHLVGNALLAQGEFQRPAAGRWCDRKRRSRRPGGGPT